MTIASNNSLHPQPQSAYFYSAFAIDGATQNTPDTPSVTLQLLPANANQRVFPQEPALVEAYVGVIERRATGKIPGGVTVPPQTQLGQWLELYRAQLEHPVVQNWMHEQKIDVTTLSVDPSTGAMSANVDGVEKKFSLTDGSGWRQISGPLLAAGRVLVPAADQNLRIRSGIDSVEVPANLVASFYGEALPADPAQTRSQIRRLEHNKSFDAIAPDDSLRPANKRSDEALELQKQNAATFYTTAPQKLAYERLALDVAKAIPDVRAEAKKWAEALIFKLTGQHVDADQIYLNRFSASQSATSATGWEHIAEEPSVSLRLPDALLKNFSEHDGIPGELDREAGLYTDGPGKSEQGGYGAHNQFPLAPSKLMHESWKSDFQAQMTQKIDSFWSAHTDDYETALKGEFAYQARKQLKTAEARLPAERTLQAPEHRFTLEDYRLVMGAAPNLPLDENTAPSVEQLKAKTPAKGIVEAHALNIHGFTSNDIVRFSAADGGRQVLYVPGAEPAFLRFDSLEKLDQWVVDQTKDPKKRESLVAHFPLIYHQDHEASFAARAAKVLMPVLWFTHVGEKKEGLDTLFEKMATGKLEGTAINHDHSVIEEDVFSTLTTASKERMTSDADVVIKSNSEVIRDTWLNDITVAAGLLVKLAPIAAPVAAAAVVAGLTELALGAEKASSGDTEAERKDGAAKAFDGLLNTLFSAGGFAGEAEDPYALPKQALPAAPRAPKSLEGFTDWVYDFLTREDAQPQLTQSEFNEFQRKYNSARTPANLANFDNGYNSGNLNSVPGYSPSLTLTDLIKMASEPWRSAEEVGTLARAIERLKIKLIQDGYPLFQRDIQSAGGTLSPMPQEYYLSQTNLASQGECAAMANTMGLAIESGDEKTFLGNLFKAAARPKEPASADFIKNLGTLQTAMTQAQDFHVAPIKQVAYSEIIADLATSADSKTLRISSTDHALLAGVNMESENPKWFYFDPNFGLATFDTPQAFQLGLERTLNRGTSPFRLRALGNDPAVPEYTISAFKGKDYAGSTLGQSMNSLFAKEL